jgi:AraC-like DNA-binding protein
VKEKKYYEEKMLHGTIELPVGVHKMSYPADSDTLFYPHWHNEFEIFTVTKGRCEVTIEEESFTLSEGDMLFINTSQLHSAVNAGDGEVTFFALDFSYEMMESDVHSNLYKEYIRTVMEGEVVFKKLMKAGEKPWYDELRTHVLRYEDTEQKDIKDKELELKYTIFAIWNLLYQHPIYKKTTDKYEKRTMGRFRPVLKYIRENYSYDITLAELAAIIPMSEGQFCRSFKSVTGYTPIQYLNRQRILMSCRALADTDESISEIARRSGFSNISYFNKVFLRTIGCTPKEYRKGERLNEF